MSAHAAISKVCAQAQEIATELHVEKRRRLALESENEDLKHTLRSVEISLNSSSPMDALDIIKPKRKPKLDS